MVNREKGYEIVFPDGRKITVIENLSIPAEFSGIYKRGMKMVTRETVLQQYEDSLRELVPKVNGFFKEHRFLSNFHYANIIYRGFEFPTTEHAYMAMKVDDKSWWDKLSKIETPKEARAVGQTCRLRDDWETVKVKFMYEVNMCKFTQHEDLRQLLLGTSPMELIENNWWACEIWGMVAGRGQNLLGKVLMKIRDELV